jgi:hypothetical protein
MLAAAALPLAGSSVAQVPRSFAPLTEAEAKARVWTLFGPMTTLATGVSEKDIFARFDQQFHDHAELHWNDHGERWESANYYDRARIYYVFWARSGNPVFLQRAHLIATNYRDRYLVPNRYGASAHWSQMAGVLMHALVTGDPKSRESVLKVAETLAAPYYLNNLGSPDAEMDNRVQARVLTAMLYAWLMTNDQEGRQAALWASRLRNALNAIARSQAADGAFRFSRSQCGFVKPFMTGMLMDALIEYHDIFDKDHRIAGIILSSVNYLWNKVLDAEANAFLYVEGACRDEIREVAPDLNLMIVNGFGFVFAGTKDKTYRDRGDRLFAAGVQKAWLQSPKTFNQNYATAYKYLAYRQ